MVYYNRPMEDELSLKAIESTLESAVYRFKLYHVRHPEADVSDFEAIQRTVDSLQSLCDGIYTSLDHRFYGPLSESSIKTHAYYLYKHQQYDQLADFMIDIARHNDVKWEYEAKDDEQSFHVLAYCIKIGKMLQAVDHEVLIRYYKKLRDNVSLFGNAAEKAKDMLDDVIDRFDRMD